MSDLASSLELTASLVGLAGLNASRNGCLPETIRLPLTGVKLAAVASSLARLEEPTGVRKGSDDLSRES